jgi:hypothetical protein
MASVRIYKISFSGEIQLKKFLLWALLLTGVGALLYGGYAMITKRMIGPRWNNLVPAMKQKTLDLLTAAAKVGLKVMFWEGWRSVEDEQADIDKKTSHLTDPYNTHHLWGSAVDIVLVDPAGLPSWPDASDPRWAQLQAIGESVGLKHPISWDKPHFELPDFSIADARAQYGTDYESYLADQGVPV